MLPLLAFNDALSPVTHDIVANATLHSTLLPQLNEFSLLDNGLRFSSKSSSLTINGLHLSAFSQSSLRVERIDTGGGDLAIPIQGYNTVDTGTQKWSFSPEGNAFFCAAEKRTMKMPKSSIAKLRLDKEVLRRVYIGMAGTEKCSDIDLRTRTPALCVGSVSFMPLFMSLFNIIDSVKGDSNLLSKLSLDDAFYRLCVGLLHPSIFATDYEHSDKRLHLRVEIQQLCEWLRANLAEPVSLTDMERRSGLSARMLQYSFQKAFGLRPKQWVRKQRLHAARAVLLNQNEHALLTSVAYDFCFASPSDFSKYYQLEFGELPSQTIKRLRR